MDNELKREIIMENYSHPFNRLRTDDESYKKINTSNSSCIDNLDIYIKFKGSVIEDIVFDGEACAISISSTSIMITNFIGKTIEEAEEYITNFELMIEGKSYDESILKEGNVYNDIYKQNNRKHCALLPYIGIKKAITDYKEKFITSK
ncbi:MAG: SUF system NifU family Fe-S cluster assembly protein [Bacilli bacterium]